VIADPPVAPAVKGTETTPPLPPDALPIVGACGTDVAVMLLLEVVAADAPEEFVAWAVKVYAVPD
jgi:hypothetical protein